jgi:general secretion pathway protein J
MTVNPHAAPRPSVKGFTLVEVLVAITVMALMALMSWRGIDAMLRTQSGLQQRADQIRTLQAGLAQWQTDLARTSIATGMSSWDWDGRVLRLTREDVQPEQGLRVVAWTWRQDATNPGGGDWLRWQSPPLRSQAAWQAAWQNARQWSQTPTDALRTGEVSIHPLAGWQLFVHRGGSWTNPLSSGVTTATPSAAATRLPDGVRLQLDLPAQAPVAGRIVLDWVRPTLSGAAS